MNSSREEEMRMLWVTWPHVTGHHNIGHVVNSHKNRHVVITEYPKLLSVV